MRSPPVDGVGDNGPQARAAAGRPGGAERSDQTRRDAAQASDGQASDGQASDGQASDGQTIDGADRRQTNGVQTDGARTDGARTDGAESRGRPIEGGNEAGGTGPDQNEEDQTDGAGGTGNEPPGFVRRHGRRRRTVAQWVVEVAVLLAAALFLLHQVSHAGQGVTTAFDHLHWHWLFLSVAAEVGSIVALSWLQQRLLRVGDIPVRVRDLLPVTMASNAVAQSLPVGTLFAEGYAFRQYQRLGASRALGVWAELSAGALAAAGLATVAVAGAVVVGPGLRLELLPGLAFILAGALVAAALFRRAPLLSRLIGRLLRRAERILPAAVCGHLRSAERSTQKMASFQPSASLWLRCLAAATLNWGLDAVVLIGGLLTVGGPVPWRGVLLCYAAAQLLVELPVTPGGLGVVEGGLIEVLTRFHVTVSRATAGTLVYRAVGYWLLLLVGWVAALWLTARNRRADRVARAPAAKS